MIDIKVIILTLSTQIWDNDEKWMTEINRNKIDLIRKMDDGKNRRDDGKQYFRVGPERSFLHYSLSEAMESSYALL